MRQDELIAIAKRLRLRGMTIGDVAEALERSESWVSVHTGAPRGPVRRWTTDDDARLKRTIADGATAAQGAAQLGRSLQAVRMRLRQLGIASSIRVRRWSAADDAALIDGLTAGQSAKEIGSVIGRSPDAILQRAHGKGFSFFEARWSRAQLVALGQFREEGATVEVIAKRLGISPAKVKKQLRKLGIKTPRYRPWTAEDVARLKQLFSQGIPISHIARHLERGIEATYRKAALLGLSRSIRRQGETLR